MPDTVLGLYLVLLCALAASWLWNYRWLVRRLGERHPAAAAPIFGTTARRKNGMDRFFALVGFTFGGQSALHDFPLRLSCFLLKALVVAAIVVFVAMMFTPFFLELGH